MSLSILKVAIAPIINFMVTIGFSLLAPAFFDVGALGLRLMLTRRARKPVWAKTPRLNQMCNGGGLLQ